LEGRLKVADKQNNTAMRLLSDSRANFDKYWLEVNFGRVERDRELEKELEDQVGHAVSFTHDTACSESKIRNFIYEAKYAVDQINDDPFIDLAGLQLDRNRVYEMAVASKNVIYQQALTIRS
tara:strand:+ start:9444 stop:9809 length:366 start_codon:yes stop_codon:yes gene_type:complete